MFSKKYNVLYFFYKNPNLQCSATEEGGLIVLRDRERGEREERRWEIVGGGLTVEREEAAM